MEKIQMTWWYEMSNLSMKKETGKLVPDDCKLTSFEGKPCPCPSK